MEEISAMIKEVAEVSQRAREAASQAVSTTQSATTIVGSFQQSSRTIDKMVELKKLAHATADAIAGVRGQVESIRSSASGAAELLASIAKRVNEVNDRQSAIAAAIEEQASTTADVTSAPLG
jgi:methyl-accepting chemotaxis protein